MRKIVLMFALGSLFLTGCPKHEVIPAPVEEVTLSAEFTGTISGATVLLKQGVQGYYLDANKAKVILPAPQPSSAVYYADMKSSQTLVSVRVSLGSVLFDAATSSDQNPSLEQLNDFLLANQTPSYSDGGVNGFDVIYRDALGKVWNSDETFSPQDVEFTSFTQESDASGDYFKFTCTFNCTVFRTELDGQGNPIEYQLPIQDGILKGWFKR